MQEEVTIFIVSFKLDALWTPVSREMSYFKVRLFALAGLGCAQTLGVITFQAIDDEASLAQRRGGRGGPLCEDEAQMMAAFPAPGKQKAGC